MDGIDSNPSVLGCSTRSVDRDQNVLGPTADSPRPRGRESRGAGRVVRIVSGIELIDWGSVESRLKKDGEGRWGDVKRVTWRET